ALALFLISAGVLSYRAYARTAIPLAASTRGLLIGLRFVAFLALLFFLMRPVTVRSTRGPRDGVVPILVDTSHSMRIADVGGRARIAQAAELVQRDLKRALGAELRTEVLAFGETLAPIDPARLTADARRSDLAGALRSAKERYRGQAVPGIVVISDGGQTGTRDAALNVASGGPPVYPIGLGARSVQHDREVLGLTAGEAPLVQSLVELSASLVSHGYGVAPFDVHLLENGRPIQVRRVAPQADGSPVRELFYVSPNKDAATLYTLRIPQDGSELVAENNARTVLVRPAGRRRRVLLVQGAPGFEHGFLLRAWRHDPGLDVDSVARKGQNERGEDTFYVQGAASRTSALASGYPEEREALFGYDAVVLANIDGSALSRAQLDVTARFVSERGGGLLVLGARSFASRGLAGTPLEEIIPVELGDRAGDVVRTSDGGVRQPNRLILTPEGERHPVMQVGPSLEDSRHKWDAMPSLAFSAALGGPRPGAIVLAMTGHASGLARPLVAIQQYGRGRSMVFSGEASWRWRMLLPSNDRVFELFWRQALRWLASVSTDPVNVTASEGAMPGEPVTVDVMARDAAFAPVHDASVVARVVAPASAPREILLSLADAATGRYTGQFQADQPGAYRILVDVRRRGGSHGTASDWTLVGGAELELADPRLNDEVLRRVALASGGRLIGTDEIEKLPQLLVSSAPDRVPPVRKDVWHNVWAFSLVVGLLSMEWIVRRRAGLR
ncbi:MAG: hypothetical protein HYX76_16075, partial [Acidobacteria bacterium]|nr:hypothetical protein [Acidobacteriota bacterium]